MESTNIIFIQDTAPDSEDDIDVFDVLMNVEGVVMHGATPESIEAAAIYLAQWDYGDDNWSPTETLADLNPYEERYWVRPISPWAFTAIGPFDEHDLQPGDYAITVHRRLGYIAFDRLVTL